MRTQHTNHGAFLGATQQTLFQLPPPPPGVQWHRTDGWQEGDLPQGWRPLLLGEPICEQVDEWKQVDENSNTWVKRIRVYPDECTGAQTKKHALHRTRRPLTFTHAGKQWTYHRPGDPMPCDGEQMVFILTSECGASEQSYKASTYAWRVTKNNWWGAIIGWRYADEKKTVPLGPEDVRCGDEVQFVQGDRRAILRVTDKAVEIHGLGSVSFLELQLSKARIRRRDSDAWEPCSKEVLA